MSKPADPSVNTENAGWSVQQAQQPAATVNTLSAPSSANSGPGGAAAGVSAEQLRAELAESTVSDAVATVADDLVTETARAEAAELALATP